MQSLHPRTEGSDNEKRAIRFIEERLSLLRIPVRKTDFSKAVDAHSFSYLLEASVPGRSSDTLIVAIPLNHPDRAAPREDGSFGIAFGLKLLEAFRARTQALSIRVVFLGGEHETGGERFLGTSRFLATFFPEERAALLYLDLRSFPAPVSVRYGGRGSAAPLWLLRSALDALAAARVPYAVRGIDLLVYRTGLEIAKTPLTGYLEAGIPALALETSGPPAQGQSVNEPAEALLRFTADFTGAFPRGLPEEWDSHYLLFTVPLLPPLLVSETAFLAILLVFTFAVIAFSMFRVAALKKYAATLKRNLWNVPFFMAAAFLILLGSTFLLEGLLALRDLPALRTAAPLPLFLLKLGVFLAASALLYRAGRRLPFSKNGSFYTAAALLFTVLCILVVAFINVSLVSYFLWPLGCIVAGSAVRSRKLKVLFFGLSPLTVVALLVQVFFLSEPRLFGVFLFNRFFGNFLFTVVVLPSLLLLIRIRIFFPYRRGGSILRSKSFLFFAAAAALSVACGVFLLAFDPYAGRPRPVLAEQFVDFDRRVHTLRLSSPVPFGGLEVVDRRGTRPVPAGGRQFAMELDEVGDYVSADYTSSRFAARKNVDVTLRFTGAPYKVNATIASNADFKLYDANFPVRREVGDRYALSIGINPPPELKLELTLPMDRSYVLELEVLYKTSSPGVEIRGDDIVLENRLRFRKTVAFDL